jgi:hypothetical protein
LIGINTADAPATALLELAKELGMSSAAAKVLYVRITDANAVFFGFEEHGDSCVCKVYLEFWDVVRAQVTRNATRQPQLLHLGVKWDAAHPDRHAVARYECHPLLGLHAILRRMHGCHGAASELSASAIEIVQTAAQRNPAASMLYLEVSEEGNPRASYDINLYKSAMTVADAAAPLRRAASWFGIGSAQIEEQLERLGQRPFGHISSGVDRHGQPFLSVYAETVAL